MKPAVVLTECILIFVGIRNNDPVDELSAIDNRTEHVWITTSAKRTTHQLVRTLGDPGISCTIEIQQRSSVMEKMWSP